ALEMQAGSSPVSARGGRWTLAARPARSRTARESAADIAAMLGLAPADVLVPILWVNAGTEQLMVPLASRAAVERARPVADRFLALESEDRPGKMLICADDGDPRGTALGRFFFPGDGTTL